MGDKDGEWEHSEGVGIRRIEDDVRGKERTEKRNWGTILLSINYATPTIPSSITLHHWLNNGKITMHERE